MVSYASSRDDADSIRILVEGYKNAVEADKLAYTDNPQVSDAYRKMIVAFIEAVTENIQYTTMMAKKERHEQ